MTKAAKLTEQAKARGIVLTITYERARPNIGWVIWVAPDTPQRLGYSYKQASAFLTSGTLDFLAQ